MEDGLVLGRMISKYGSDVSTALRAYETLRVPRATRVQLTSREQGKKNHLVSPWARLRRDIVYRVRNLINPQKTGLSAGWVYEYDADRVDMEEPASHASGPSTTDSRGAETALSLSPKGEHSTPSPIR
jgi:salicylate hydroxylase